MEPLKTGSTPSAIDTLHDLSVRAASLDDVTGIHKLLKYFSDRGILLPRSESDIYQSLREFQIIRLGEKVIACCALQIFTRSLGEIRSLAVSPEYSRSGLGRRMVLSMEREAQDIGLEKLMALTYEVQFFNRMGFDVVEMSVLPEKVWGACINCHKFRNCDEIAVLKNLSSTALK